MPRILFYKQEILSNVVDYQEIVNTTILLLHRPA